MAVLALLLEVCGLLGFTWWLLSRYRDAHVSTISLAAVFLSWTLGFVGLLLLPIDIARHGNWPVAQENDDDDSASATKFSAFVTGWLVLYWLTFALGWLVLPLLVEIAQHGEFQFERRLVGSLQRLILHWTIMVAVAAAAAVYLLFVGHFTAQGLAGLAMATANVYGLVWLILLLGYGLVDTPRSLWTQRDPEQRLRALYFRATQVHHERMEAIFLYHEVLRDVRAAYDRMLQAEGASIILTTDMQDVKGGLCTVLALVDGDDREASVSPAPPKTQTKMKPASSPMLSTSTMHLPLPPPSYSAVVELHRRVKAAQADLRGTEQAWLGVCVRADAVHQLVERHTAVPPVGLYSTTNLLAQLQTLATTAVMELQRLLQPTLWTLAAVVTACGSLGVVWGELTLSWNMDALSLVHVLSLAGPSGLEIAVFALLLYMAVCAYASLCTLRSFGRFGLRTHGNSSELALLKTSIYQCRLQFALIFNLVLLLHAPTLTNATAFHELWIRMQVVRVLGRDVSLYVPMLMVLLVACTVGKMYARVIKQVFGMDQYEQLMPGDADHEKQVVKGEQLLRKARDKLRRQNEQRVLGGGIASSDGTSGGRVQWRGRGIQAPQELVASLLGQGDGEEEEDGEHAMENVA